MQVKKKKTLSELARKYCNKMKQKITNGKPRTISKTFSTKEQNLKTIKYSTKKVQSDSKVGISIRGKP